MHGISKQNVSALSLYSSAAEPASLAEASTFIRKYESAKPRIKQQSLTSQVRSLINSVGPRIRGIAHYVLYKCTYLLTYLLILTYLGKTIYP